MFSQIRNAKKVFTGAWKSRKREKELAAKRLETYRAKGAAYMTPGERQGFFRRRRKSA